MATFEDIGLAVSVLPDEDVELGVELADACLAVGLEVVEGQGLHLCAFLK